MERYRGRCEAVLIRLTGRLPSEALDRAQRLIDHGEPSEGLCGLAWLISDQRIHVPTSDICEIKELTAGMVPPEHLPPDLDDYAVPS
jgi:hypothetical protein